MKGSGGSSEIESLFKKMDSGQKAAMLEKVHQMRLRAYEKRKEENTAKPHFQVNESTMEK